jgi:(2R)-3-sulfolactate dehydrogenase (NADP+)
MSERVLSIAEAEALVRAALEANAVSAPNAASVARALVAAEVDGQGGHGLARVASYAAQARSGKVDGHAAPVAETDGDAFLRVDARNGFAFPAIDLAIARLAPMAERHGVAAAAIARSHHSGQLGAHVERLAERGLVALMVANTPQAMAPWGGDAPLFGTNPIAFAAPRRDAAPLVIDLSLSKVARGKIMAAKKRGAPIPEGWALDASGAPTTDAEAALGGMLIPMGDAKGAALALMVEILAATLTGAHYSFEATSFFDAEGAPPGVGQLILVFHAGSGAGGPFLDRMDTLMARIAAQEGARLPGKRRLAARAEAAERGVRAPAHLLEEIARATAG